jgi:hypothetical protein
MYRKDLVPLRWRYKIILKLATACDKENGCERQGKETVTDRD